jgi:hypothetical protein
MNKVNIDINMVTTKDILRVYSGRPGCGCGCRGSYRYNPEHAKEAFENRKAIPKPSDFNAVQVRKVLGLMKQHSNEVECDISGAAWETDARYYWVYFTKAFIDEHQRAHIRSTLRCDFTSLAA